MSTSTPRPADIDIAQLLADGIRTALDALGLLHSDDVGVEWALPVRVSSLDGSGELHHRIATLASPGLDPAVKRDLLRRAAAVADKQADY